MAIRIVRLGEPRHRDEGLRIGTVRRVPRGVRKEEYAKRDFFDVWLPALAPSEPLRSWGLAEPWTERRWARYAREYRREMKNPDAARLIALLAALSHGTALSVGCYCEDASHCHRAVLRDLLVQAGARLQEDDASEAPSSAQGTAGERGHG
jgi:uncharacterized protein YeaO (DUF488 family)